MIRFHTPSTSFTVCMFGYAKINNSYIIRNKSYDFFALPQRQVNGLVQFYSISTANTQACTNPSINRCGLCSKYHAKPQRCISIFKAKRTARYFFLSKNISPFWKYQGKQKCICFFSVCATSVVRHICMHIIKISRNHFNGKPFCKMKIVKIFEMCSLIAE